MDEFYTAVLTFLNSLLPSAIDASYLDMNEFIAYLFTMAVFVCFVVLPIFSLPYFFIKKIFKS